jgi:UDP-4-amino-4-deoxy-L-arabinose formyltransferase/UDP-glucuronic acid dehydrogenase (UDP-4-keto-hexauronic acid decarboxylating)
MDPNEVDAGSVFARERFPLADDTTIGDVYAWLDKAIPELFVKAVERSADPSFCPEHQRTDSVRPLRCHPRRPEDGLIDWSRSSIEIGRLVRASSKPFSGAFTFIEGEERVTIWRARPVELAHEVLAVPGQIMGRGEGTGVLVACGSGVMEILEAEREGGGSLSAANRFRLVNFLSSAR